MKCARCADLGWVCENHLDRPWDDSKPGGCTCGAGAPCPVRNPSSRGQVPFLPPVLELDRPPEKVAAEDAAEDNVIALVERAWRKRWHK